MKVLIKNQNQTARHCGLDPQSPTINWLLKPFRHIMVLLFAVVSLNSCDFLDVVPDDMPTLDHAFNNRAMAERYLFTCYSYLPNPADYYNYPALMAGGEIWAYYGASTWFVASQAYALQVARGLQNANAPCLNYWNGAMGGINLFVALRDCNIFLENIHKAVDLEPFERDRWIAEVKFLKAYYHFFLLRSYGPIPIIDENIPVSALPEETLVYREPVEKVAEYIVSLLDETVKSGHLPLYIENETEEMGRITQPIALAIKAKTLLLMASPMFNGNPYYRDMTDNRGINLFPTAEDPDKWQTAAEAIWDAIECAHSARHELYYYRGFNPISDDTKAKLNIRGAVTDRWNPEIIWGSTKSSGSLQSLSYVRYNANQTVGTLNMLAPTMDVAERFYSANGLPIEEDKNFDYENRYEIGIVQANQRYFMREGFETARLHLNRETRFYASLFFDGCMVYGNGIVSDDPATMYQAQMKRGQPGGMIDVTRYSITGYLPQKLVHINSGLSATGSAWTQYNYAFPYIRLADLYLMYAEALNEIKTAPDEHVFFWIDEVRDRASIPKVRDAWTETNSRRPGLYATKEGMREIIRRERLIELACEGENYWDLLRWKEAEKEMSRPIRGWNAHGMDTGEYYNVMVIERRSFGIKDYLTPIRQESLDRNRNLVQNPGW